MTVDVGSLKLGRRPSPNDRRTVWFEPYLDVQNLPAPPPSRDWSKRADGAVVSLSMFANNAIGDCTCAAIAHHDQVAALQTGTVSTIITADVTKLYEGSGYRPGDHSSDQGWTNLEAAKAAKAAGWIEGFAKFQSTRTMLQLVINEFGAAYVGADLPMAAQKQLGHTWDVAPAGGRTDEYDRGSWGGHAMSAIDYDHDGVVLATWGKLQRATWSWVFTYVDEAMVLLNRRWAMTAIAPPGIDVAGLRADIKRLS